MPTTIVLSQNTSFNSTMLAPLRIEQYINGIEKIVELNTEYGFDIFIADNGLNFEDVMILPEATTTCLKILKHNPNQYGCTNKGAGLLEIWCNNVDILQQYDYVIHFEPRQLLENNTFIDNFMTNPRTLFSYGKGKDHFNTGLFTIKTSELLNFIQAVSPATLVQYSLSIEIVLLRYYNQNKIPYSVADKMNLVWFSYCPDTSTILEYHW